MAHTSAGPLWRLLLLLTGRVKVSTSSDSAADGWGSATWTLRAGQAGHLSSCESSPELSEFQLQVQGCLCNPLSSYRDAGTRQGCNRKALKWYNWKRESPRNVGSAQGADCWLSDSSCPCFYSSTVVLLPQLSWTIWAHGLQLANLRQQTALQCACRLIAPESAKSILQLLPSAQKKIEHFL